MIPTPRQQIGPAQLARVAGGPDPGPDSVDQRLETLLQVRGGRGPVSNAPQLLGGGRSAGGGGVPDLVAGTGR